MKRIMPAVGGIFFAAFSVAIVVFLLSLSWSALSRIFPENIVNQLFGLANFDFAALGWLLCFIYVAKGSAQRPIAFVMFMVSLLGTLVIVALEIGLSTGWFEMASVMTPLSILLTVMTFLHMAAIYLFHLNDPEVAARIESESDKDAIIDQAQKDTTEALNVLRPGLARQLAQSQVAAALRDLGLPAVVDGVSYALDDPAPASDLAAKPHQEKAREAGAEPTGVKPGLMDWQGWNLFGGRKDEPGHVPAFVVEPESEDGFSLAGIGDRDVMGYGHFKEWNGERWLHTGNWYRSSYQDFKEFAVGRSSKELYPEWYADEWRAMCDNLVLDQVLPIPNAISPQA